MLNFDVKTIPHSEQRYPTVGDYWRDQHKMKIRVSDMQNKDYEFLVAVHELIEWYLVEKRGISMESIDLFDVDFEKKRVPGDDAEPGDSPVAPYRREHRFAENIERLIAQELGIDWFKYDDTVTKL